MWESGAVSILGLSHLKADKENQDCVLLAELFGAQLAVVCDGAGSADNSALGAKILTETLSRNFEALSDKIIQRPHDNSEKICKTVKLAILEAQEIILSGQTKNVGVKKSSFLKSILSQWLNPSSQTQEIKVAEGPTVDLNGYAATLLICVVSDDQAWLGHIGDGYVFGLNVVCVEDPQSPDLSQTDKEQSENIGPPSSVELAFRSLPENGEYDNETYFFTDQSWEEHFRHHSFSGDFNLVALFTDGAEPFLVERNKKDFLQTHAQKLWSAKHTHKQMTISEILGRFYSVEKVHNVSTDDTTIGLLIK